ncbi:MAG: nucleotidyltransferase domain-containing protein [Candidatus Hatepunaea meridiana]|nr:nucleotidyltransferase domain-containing protein [Candidatus Hatepunaea meridiana]
MKKHDKYVFELFSSAIRKKFPDARIWAFGSRVRGDVEEFSDLDVCIVVEHLDDKVYAQIVEIAWQIGFDNEIIISTIPYSHEEFEDGPCSVSPLVYTILNEGIPA